MCFSLELVVLNRLKASDDSEYVMKRTKIRGRARQADTTKRPPRRQAPIVNKVPIFQKEYID